MVAASGIEAVAAVIGTAITPKAKRSLGSDVTAMGMDPEGEDCELAKGEPAAKEHEQPDNALEKDLSKGGDLPDNTTPQISAVR